MVDELRRQLDEVHARQRQQSACRHEDFAWTYVANRVGHGALQVWRRCDGCGANRLGAGKWVPHDSLESEGVALGTIPIVHDDVRERPRCGASGGAAALV